MLANYTDAYTRSWCSNGDITFVQLSDGTRLRYLRTGSGSSLVLLHTLRTQLDYFQRLIPRLASKYTVYAFDLPGLGWSEIQVDASYEEPAVRSALTEAIQKLGLTDVTMVGESMGATLSLTIAAAGKCSVSQVFALNTYDYPQGVERSNLLASFVVKAMKIPGFGEIPSKNENAAILGAILGGGFYDKKKLPAEFVDELIKSGKRPNYPKVETGYFRALPSYMAARGLYKNISVPVTLVYGDHDWSKPKERQEVLKILPKSRFITLQHSGHFGSLEHPEEIANIILTGSQH